MPSFSRKSMDRLNTCDPKLQAVMAMVVKYFDCSILEGHRSAERQAELVAQGKSKVAVSKHNSDPSVAVDVAPYPVEWPDRDHPDFAKHVARFYAFGAFVKAIGLGVGVDIRWGGDWDGDWEFTDQSFDDLVHFELVNHGGQY